MAAFVHKFGGLYRPNDLLPFLRETYSEAALAAELADPAKLYQVAEQDGELIGWCKLGLVCGFPEQARGQRVMELKQLYLAPNATGGGLGRRLMDWAMAEFSARGADEVQLSVWSGNPGAQRFYQRYGFAKVADITFRVGSQLDEEFLFARLF
ncbi:GNAT family N-acetyltransferase [Novosphingobium piscinae]|uniref:GNAT family N-acetyltransferase n=2 Tax=Novosphingobium piscinae TaxID=1507448 RepID=A0A7X1G0J1_9SPHN|nr:GNAT family N-acetyltransferase [Novosphingobium piscinae]MBC2669722.1 GNAT family N-acetyltransferase [Novosphingobium piscinae]